LSRHTKYCRYSMAIKMKENIVGFDASPTAIFFFGVFEGAIAAGRRDRM
jgi:hypothetical protein